MSRAEPEFLEDHLLLLSEDGRVLFSRSLTHSTEPSPAGERPDAALVALVPATDPLTDVAVPPGARVLVRGPLAAKVDQDQGGGESGPVAPVPPERDEGNTPEARAEMLPETRQLHAASLAATVLGSKLELDDLLENIADYGTVLFDVPGAAVLLPPREGGPFWIAAQRGLSPQAEAKGIRAETLTDLGFAGGVPLLLPDLQVLDQIPLFEQLAAEGFHAALSLPLLSDEGFHGLLMILDRKGITMERVDLEAFKLFAMNAANTLRSVEHHAADRRTAEILRHSILAVPRPLEGVSLAFRYQPATSAEEVGGDFYDVFRMPGGRVALAVGDVSGKGLDAASATTLTKYALQAYAHIDSDPGRVLTLTNRLLAHQHPEVGFVTVAFAVFEPGTRRLQYALAGHPPILRKDEHRVGYLEQHSSPLGALPDTSYTTDQITLNPGELVMAYTDGVIEARRRHEFFGEDRLRRVVTEADPEPESVVAGVDRELQEFTGGDLRDDACFLAVSFPEGQAP